jgi:hypothetical protein
MKATLDRSMQTALVQLLDRKISSGEKSLASKRAELENAEFNYGASSTFDVMGASAAYSQEARAVELYRAARALLVPSRPASKA